MSKQKNNRVPTHDPSSLSAPRQAAGPTRVEAKRPRQRCENPLIVKPFPTNKSKVKIRPYMENHTIPKHPFRCILSGSSGSGKTNLLLHLLTQNAFYKDYFDIIFIISPTAGKLDDSYDVLNKSNPTTEIRIINDLDEDKIQQIMSTNKAIILEKKVHKSPKILIVYDDVISNKKFMNTKPFTHSFIASRHYNASVFICSQKYNGIPRVCRIQANAIMYFQGTNCERETMAVDHAPPGHSKREMESIIDFATGEPYSFLFINKQAQRGEQFRKNLDQILKLKK
jgi:hypothetical protein